MRRAAQDGVGLDWECVGVESVVDNDWLRMEARRYRLPSGVMVEPYYVTGARDWACGVPVMPDGRLVLVRQYRCGAKKVTWEFPAGVIDGEETEEAAARRELIEETGCEVLGEGRLLSRVHPEPARNETKGVGYLFNVGGELSGQRLDHSESIEVLCCTVDEIFEAQREGIFCHAAHIAFLYQALGAGLVLGWEGFGGAGGSRRK